MLIPLQLLRKKQKRYSKELATYCYPQIMQFKSAKQNPIHSNHIASQFPICIYTIMTQIACSNDFQSTNIIHIYLH